MSDPAILFVKPKAIKAADKRALKTAGVIVVEVDDPGAVKLTRAYAEISGSHMLGLAAKAIRQSGDWTRRDFADLICAAIEFQTSPPPTEGGGIETENTKDG